MGLRVDLDEPGVRKTPARMAAMYAELCAGSGVDPASVVDAFFEEPYDELILVRDIAFASLCEHHLLPYVGKAHVG